MRKPAIERLMRALARPANGILLGFLIGAALLGCAPSSRSGLLEAQRDPGDRAANLAPPKRISAVMMGDPPTLTGASSASGTAGSTPGLDTLEELITAGLANFTADGSLRPQLAEAVPALENGLWRLEPDGRMELTWRIRDGAQWQDGTAFTTADLLFTLAVAQDPELPTFGHPALGLVESVEAPDSRTVVVRWREPFIRADSLFSRAIALPLPRHILERPYRDDHAAFLQQPYWNQQFVGTGPYRVRDRVGGVHILLEAHDRYVLGRPKIDVIDIAIVPDSNALVTHVLAGASEMSVGARLSVDQAVQVRERWDTGRVVFSQTSWLTNYPQLLNPSPAIIGNIQFRRALQHATDREQIVLSLMQGVSEICDTTVAPNTREYREIESALVRTPYDPRLASQLIASLGYEQGSDGAWRDAAGARLTVEIRATALSDIQPKTLAVIADSWRTLGLGVDEVVIPAQLVRDREYRNSRPGFEVLQVSNEADTFQYFHSAQIPTAQNNYLGTNRSRYASAELDALIDTYFRTIPRAERIGILREVVRHTSEQLPFLGVFYGTSSTLIGNRMVNIGGRNSIATEGWNAEQWDVRS